SGSSSSGRQVQALALVLAIVFVILAPIAARLLYFAISRRREYLADASGTRLTRYPEGLASALEKISSAGIKLASANQVTAPMYIANPFQGKGMSFSGLLSTHPPVDQRIKILRNLSQGVNYLSYQKAYESVIGRSETLIPPSGLKDQQEIPIKKAGLEEPKIQSPKDQAREIGDLTRAVYRYAFLTCSCGLKIKVPPDFKRPKIICPKCWHEMNNPFLSKDN
ncbi:MAG: M48 family metalloprotease, partial [Candidatus Omnitrophica bacterium]|nr:M48 family metalloprotease [Candidatus Omnitrophota bacterium]